MLGSYVIAAVTLVLVLGLQSDQRNATRERQQLCAFVDAEHNKTRADIVQDERDLYTKYAKSFSTFIDTPEKRQQIHERNAQRYARVRHTRPPYCESVRTNPVTPYPSLQQIRRGPPAQ